MNETKVIYSTCGRDFESKKELNKFISAYKLLNGDTVVEITETKTIHKIVTKTYSK